jgi:DNA-binding FrmR family transcriptional regulator
LNNEQKKAVQALKTARGQIEGIIKMIEDGRYCVDVSNQISATQSLLKKSNLLILKQHMHHCVVEAVEQNRGSEKIEEIINLLSKAIDK